MRPRLSNNFVLERKRVRILEVAAKLVSEKGVDGTKLSDLTRSAGISRLTFYEIFDGKNDCLEQTLSWIGAAVRRQMVDALANTPSDLDALARHGLAALLDFVAERPDQAYFYLLFGPAVSLAIFEAEQKSFSRLLERSLVLDELSQAMVVGGVAWTLRLQLLKRSDQNPRLLLDGLSVLTATASCASSASGKAAA
jgi:AcrR family transcriptional regulator